VASFVEVIALLESAQDLTRLQAADALSEILDGAVSAEDTKRWLVALAAKGETASEMSGFIDAMMAAATTFAVDENAMDIVGTGGDRLHSVNISTMAALTVAGCGVPVAKHGNRAASSSVGTADVLEALGVKLDPGPDKVRECVEKAGIGFCFAPSFHPGLRHLAPIRRELGIPTAFNVLGPLANPAEVRRLLIGVANPDWMGRMAEVIQDRPIDMALLVHADDGLDELSLGSPSTLLHVSAQSVGSWRFDPATLGLHHDTDSIRGGDITVNVAAVKSYLDGTPGAIFDTVIANAGLALTVAGLAESIDDGRALATKSVVSGRAAVALHKLIEVSNS
jgi:anthranilate phosphoribosyltransferase